ncbi:MAG: acyl-[acyl-carrier-protein] thioesterase [Tannerella sp.]|jgi:acyl-ACP thioesterase|nr:acyl-[acyl-carrier-protein] thioesterase [Tannerella sp.]
MTPLAKTGEYRFITESYLLDFRGRVTIPMIGNYMLHAASNHASLRGFGFGDMTEKRAVWVLSRLAMEIARYPELSEPVVLYTWIDEVGRVSTCRCFELVDAAGTPVVHARSIWAAIDMQTRRPSLLDVEALSAYVTADRRCPVGKPGKISPAEDGTDGVPYEVKYSDLDINGHFNSIKYMEHLLDLFDLDLFTRKEVQRFEIAYISEGRYGMPLTLHKKETAADSYCMAICREGKAICRAAAEWTVR